jgi:hypothetical protein
MSRLTESLQSPTNMTNVRLNAEEGFSSIFNTLATYINKWKMFKDSPITPQEIQTRISILSGVIFELCGYLCAYLSVTLRSNYVDKEPQLSGNSKVGGFLSGVFKRKKGKLSGVTNNIVPFKLKKLVDVDKESRLSAKCEVEQILTDADMKKYIEKYLDCMYSTRTKIGDSRGFKYIGGQIGIDAKTAEKIKAHLETLGIIEVRGSRTKILKEVV